MCGSGHDVVVLGRGDVTEDDGCEEIKRPGEGKEACAAGSHGCPAPEPCAARDGGGCPDQEPCAARDAMDCDPSDDEHCVATYPSCDDPVWNEPEPDPADEEQGADGPGDS